LAREPIQHQYGPAPRERHQPVEHGREMHQINAQAGHQDGGHRQQEHQADLARDEQLLQVGHYGDVPVNPPRREAYHESTFANNQALNHDDAMNVNKVEAGSSWQRKLGIGAASFVGVVAVTAGVTLGTTAHIAVNSLTTSKTGGNPDPEEPDARDETLINQPKGETVTVPIKRRVRRGAHGKDVDLASLKFLGQDGVPIKLLEVEGEGVWTASETELSCTFEPDPELQVDPTPVAYQVADVEGRTSEPAFIYIHFLVQGGGSSEDTDPVQPGTPLLRPTVFDQLLPGPTEGRTVVSFDVVNGYKPGAAAFPGEHGLNPESVVLLSVLTDDRIDGTVGPNGKSLTVQSQGVWTVRKGGIVTFEPAATFDGEPYPVRYAIADTEGNLSTPATLIVSSAGVEVERALKETAEIGDEAFWAKVREQLVDRDPPPELDVIHLTLVMLITGLARVMKPTDKDRALNPSIKPPKETFDNAYDDWVIAGLTPEALLSTGDIVTAESTGLADVPLGVRLARLRFILDLLNRFFDERDKEMDG